MKKLMLSVCLLGVIASPALQAFSLSSIFTTSLTETLTGPRAQKYALIGAVAWYFLCWKKRKPVEVDGKSSAWNYFNKEILGNPKKEVDADKPSTDKDGNPIVIKVKETLVEESGLFGTIDAMVISKLKDIVEFIKNVKSFNAFLDNPASELGL